MKLQQKPLDMDYLIQSYLRQLHKMSLSGDNYNQSEEAIPISSVIDVYHNHCAEENSEQIESSEVAPPSILGPRDSSIFKNSEDLSHPQILVSQTANSKNDEVLAN